MTFLHIGLAIIGVCIAGLILTVVVLIGHSAETKEQWQQGDEE